MQTKQSFHEWIFLLCYAGFIALKFLLFCLNAFRLQLTSRENKEHILFSVITLQISAISKTAEILSTFLKARTRKFINMT